MSPGSDVDHDDVFEEMPPVEDAFGTQVAIGGSKCG